MRNKIFFLVLALVVIYCNNTNAQNLSISIDSTENIVYKNPYFKPVKPNTSFNFVFLIVNNDNNKHRILLPKPKPWGNSIWDKWFEIPNYRSIEIAKGDTASFRVVVNVPYGEVSRLIGQVLDLYVDGNSISSTFDYVLLIDNEPPTAVNINLTSTTDRSITVSVSAFDELSDIFTSHNSVGFGKDGIERFDIKVKTMSGTTVATKSIEKDNHWNNIVVSSSNIHPYTKYKISVDATDLAGNTATSASKTIRTAAAAPTLYVSNITYTTCKLYWSASTGATSYKVYDITSGQGVLLGSTLNTYYNVSGITPGATRKYAVRTVSAEGVSGYSNVRNVTTIKPLLIGTSTVCKNATYTIENLLTTATVNWSINTKDLTLIPTNNPNEVNVKFSNTNINVFGIAKLLAKVNLHGKEFKLVKDIYYGLPDLFFDYRYNSTYKTLQLEVYLSPNFEEVFGNYLSYRWIDETGRTYAYYEETPSYLVRPVIRNVEEGSTINVRVFIQNARCKVSRLYSQDIYIPHSDGEYHYFSLFPNPATNVLTLKFRNNKRLYRTINSGYQIQIWNSHSLLKTINTKSLEVEIPVSDLKTGYYYAVVTKDGKTTKQQFFKQ